MSFKVVNRQILSLDIKRIDILAPGLARAIQPGQFVIVTLNEHDHRKAFSVTEVEINRGSLALIFQEEDLLTQAMGRLQIDDEIHLMTGPYGKAVKIDKWGLVACIADDLGIVQALPVVRALKQADNKVCTFMGAKTKAGLILQSQMRVASYKIFMATQDGSWERRGSPADSFKDFLNKEKPAMVYAAGSVDLMQKISQLTAERGIKTFVQLKPVMFDGVGLCGSCRVTVGGQVRLACVDGPVFNGHEVDFEDYRIRLNAYKELAWEKPVSQKRGGFKIFEKFPSGILKN